LPRVQRGFLYSLPVDLGTYTIVDNYRKALYDIIWDYERVNAMKLFGKSGIVKGSTQLDMIRHCAEPNQIK